VLNRDQNREDRGSREHKIHQSETANNAAINLNPPVLPGSVLPGHVRGDGRSGTPRDNLAPELAARGTLPQRHSTREVGEPTPSSVPAKEPMAGCG
jgi:hypothetical protein